MTYAQDWREKSNFPALISTDSNVTQPMGYFGVELITATATTLNIGDAVYINSAGAAAKSATAANYATFAGIVVGGYDVPYNANAAAFGSNTIGTLASNAGHTVKVAQVGVVWGIADVAITAGANVGVGATTAGRLSGAAASNNFGTALLAASGAAVAFPVLLNTTTAGAIAGGITGSGTSGDLAVFTASGAIGNSNYTNQASAASGGALVAYTTGAFGLDSDVHMHALYTLVVNIRAALVANGIMS
jgi:hypothetical protein